MDNNFKSSYYTTENELQSTGFRKPTLAQISVLYSVAVILLLYVGFAAQKRSLFPGLLITEFGLILPASLVLLFIYKYDFRKVLRLNKVRFTNLLLVFGIMLFALPVVGVFNLLNLLVIDNIFGRVIISEMPTADNSMELLRNVLIIAGSAAICEEVMFRGVIQRGLERFGAVKAILVSAFLFGLLHLDFQRFLGTFLLGALIGFLVYRSNSIYSGMFAHFCNNAFAVLGAFLGTKLNQITKASGISNANNDIFSIFENMPKDQLAAFIIVWGFIFMVSAIFLVGLLIAYIRTTSGKAERISREKVTHKKAGLLWLTPGLIIVAAWYFVIGLRLYDETSPLADSIMRAMLLK